ncbi:hypothetical protein M0R45_034007 [Rubus argutus]|uniref:Plastocyanin-like domain-containing protein n=1 Tax=Rubus argutus TaxID=59490 RepID=A0AAW1VUF2_RUBAR
MAWSGNDGRRPWLIVPAILLIFLACGAYAEHIFLDWDVAIDTNIKPAFVDQPVITINGKFPGPLINATTNDVVHVNVFNHVDEPLLITWNGIQQRLNSWQDGVSGTNCPILPGTNWTYVFQLKDQIGTFSYFPSINFLKAGGALVRFRSIIVQSSKYRFRNQKPNSIFSLVIGIKRVTRILGPLSAATKRPAYNSTLDKILMNGKGSFRDPLTKAFESFTVTQGRLT